MASDKDTASCEGEAFGEGAVSYTDVADQKPGLTRRCTASSTDGNNTDGMPSVGSLMPEKETSSRMNEASGMSVVLYHIQTKDIDMEVMEQARQGYWMTVGKHLQNMSERLGIVSKPACHHQVLKNFDDMIARQPTLQAIGRQLNALWYSAVEERERLCYGVFVCQISPTVRQWLTKKVGQGADAMATIFIARFLTDDERAMLIRELVQRENWRLVFLLIARGFANGATHQWALEEAAQKAERSDFIVFIVPCCTADTDNDPILEKLVGRDLFPCVIRLLERKLCSKQCSLWALEEAAKRANPVDLILLLNKDIISGYKLDSLLIGVSERGLWRVVWQLLRSDCVADSQTRLSAIRQVLERADGKRFQAIIEVCTIEELDFIIRDSATRGSWKSVSYIFLHVNNFIESGMTSDMAELWPRLYTDKTFLPVILRQIDSNFLDSLLTEAVRQNLPFLLDYVFARERHYSRKFGILSTFTAHETETDPSPCENLPDAELLEASLAQLRPTFDEIFEQISKNAPVDPSSGWQDLVGHVQKWTSVVISVHAEIRTELASQWRRTLVHHLLERVAGMKAVTVQYACLKIVLALVPLIPSLQNIALKDIVKSTSPDFAIQARWFYVQEEVRRFLFKNAVTRSLWELAMRLADQPLYVDQRVWALDAVMANDQWRLSLTLAQQGLTPDQQSRVFEQVARLGDWDTVLEMFERRGADVHAVVAATASNICQEQPHSRRARQKSKSRLADLEKLREKIEVGSEDFDTALNTQNWAAVLCKVRRGKVTSEELSLAIETAREAGQWHALTHLVGCEGDDAQRDALFLTAMMEGQWSSAAVFLEQGVSLEMRLSALPRLVETRRWELVSNVMEKDIDDTSVYQTMEVALKCAEGSVVCRCLDCLTRPLTVSQRRDIFCRALSQGLWKALLPLVQVKDDQGRKHRDEAFAAAMERGHWDVVSSCVEHGADVNRRDRQGYTVLHRCGRNNLWERVEGFLRQGADPNLLDPEGYSVMHIAMSRSSVLVTGHDPDTSFYGPLIKFGGLLSVPDRNGETPLSYLIRVGDAHTIRLALTSGQHTMAGISDSEGNTALHVICQSGSTGFARCLVAGGSNPLAKNKKGRTILCAATEDPQRAREMVVECLELGVGTFQQPITDKYHKKKMTHVLQTPLGVQKCEPASPFQQAAILGDLTLMDMLYEAGACSNAELRRFSRSLKKEATASRSRMRKTTMELFEYVHGLARTPRGLKSSCRLVISHHLGVQWDRRERVKRLNQLSESMKDYVLYTSMSQPDA